jgi:hypothetical protein
MPDEDYSSYLKRQSYDDLLAISYNLNKDGHPDLYAMVLAEIAIRDNRGEKPERKTQGTASLVLGVLFVFLFFLDLLRSRAGWAIINLAVGIVSLIIGWYERKKWKGKKLKGEKPVS